MRPILAIVAIGLLALPGAAKAVGEPVLIATVSDASDSSAISITDSDGAAPPPPASHHHAHQSVSGFRVRVVRAGAKRMLVVRATVTQPAQAKLLLQRGSRTVTSAGRRFRPGPNQVRVQLRRSVPAGRYVVRLTIGGAAQSYTARIRLG